MMWILIVIIAVVLLWLMLGYNRLVGLVNRTKEAWSDIDVQLKRRFDLIPNLVETVKGYASHEKETLDRVIQARAKAMSAQSVQEKGDADNMLTGALKSIFALSESYPDLKANQNFLSLQQELSGTENKIQASRRFYNGNVRDLNTAIQTFPSNVIAGIFAFKAQEFFELEAGSNEREPVAVKF